MTGGRVETEWRRLQAAAAEARAIAEKGLREHAAHVERARSYLDDAEAKRSLSHAEIEIARAAVDEAERHVRDTIRDTLADVDSQTREAISALTNRS